MVQELYPLLCGLGSLNKTQGLEIYEEVKFEPSVMVERLAPSVTLAAGQLEHGDILIFQRQLSQVCAQHIAKTMQCCVCPGYAAILDHSFATLSPTSAGGS